MVDLSELYFLYLLFFLLSEDTWVSYTVEWDLNQYTLSFDNNVVFEFILLVKDNIFVSLKIEVLVTPVLSGLGKEVSASEFFYPSL